MKLTPLITCEHAGKIVPDAYSHLFAEANDILESHRGWDPGAMEIAMILCEQVHAPFFKCEATRLLVEPNRSISSQSLFSEYTLGLTEAERQEVLRQYYYPHRSGVEQWIRDASATILHLSIHTFTPVFHGHTRMVDIGLLFDPARVHETEFCNAYRSALERVLPDFVIQFNEPYKGIDDGFTTHLRTLFPDEEYLGIEIEVNQKYNGTARGNMIASILASTLSEMVGA